MGRQRGSRRTRVSIPVGIEKALYRAAVEPEFRQRLLSGGIDGREMGLSASEAGILESIPPTRLEFMIDRIRPGRHGKRGFMKSIATAVVTLATGTATISCDDEQMVKGSVSDTPVDLEFPDAVEGIMPDAPPDVALDEEDAEEDVEEEG